MNKDKLKVLLFRANKALENMTVEEFDNTKDRDYTSTIILILINKLKYGHTKSAKKFMDNVRKDIKCDC